MTGVVFGVDASTTAVKVIAWDAAGIARAEARAAYPLENPSPGAWEQDAQQWWRATLEALADCRKALPKDQEVLALCIAHQRETFVLTGADGQPLRPALVWMDSRGKQSVAEARGALTKEQVHEISGKPACITPSFYKLHALFARDETVRREDLRVLDVHAFLVWQLTGSCATSLASADPLGLVDMRARDWSTELLARLKLTRAQVPALHNPGAFIADLRDEIAGRTGLPKGLPVVAGLGDGQAAGLGAGLVAPGRAYLNLGTAIVSGVLCADYQISNAFRTLYAGASGSYLLETDLLGGTFTLNWLENTLLGDDGAPRPGLDLNALEQRARRLPPGAEGLLLVPYFAGVMNPYWDDEASGVMLGLTASHGPAHFYRAIIEGLALEHRIHTEGVESALGRPIEEFIVMGGGSRSDLWCQVLSNVLDRPIVRCGTSEATCLGAGMLAAVHSGLHASLTNAASAMTRTGLRFTPNADRQRYAELFEIYRGIYPSVRQSSTALARFRDRTNP